MRSIKECLHHTIGLYEFDEMFSELISYSDISGLIHTIRSSFFYEVTIHLRTNNQHRNYSFIAVEGDTSGAVKHKP